MAYPPAMPDAGRTDARRAAREDVRVAAALAFALTVFALLLTRFPTWSWPGGDAYYYATITEALVEGGSLDLQHWPPGEERAVETTLVRNPDGSIYTIFPLGLPLAQLPAFATGRAISKRLDDPSARLFVETMFFGLTPALLYGLTALFLYRLLRHLQFNVPWSALGVALYCTATLAFFFSRHNGVEPLQTFLLAWMVYVLLVPGRWSSPIAAFSYGLAVLAKPTAAVTLPVAAFLYLKNRVWQTSPWSARLLAAGIGLSMAALFFWYNDVRSGDPVSAYASAKQLSSFTLTRLPSTLWPVLIGPDRNVFLNNPLFLLALPGFFLLRSRTYLITALGCWSSYLLIYGMGGNKNWGAYVGNARYLVPLGFLLIPYVVATVRWVARSRPPALRWLLTVGVVGVIASSLYVQLLFASFSEFHVKHYERFWNRAVRDWAGEQLGMPEIDEAKHQLRFAHHLFWLTSGSHPDELEEFPHPSRESEQARFGAAVLRRSFNDRWFRKDYMFLNGSAFQTVGFFDATRNALLLATLAGLGLAARLGWRAHAATGAGGPAGSAPSRKGRPAGATKKARRRRS